MRRAHAPALVLLAVALAVGLAGCSSDGDSDGGSDSVAAESAPNAATGGGSDGDMAALEQPLSETADLSSAYQAGDQAGSVAVQPAAVEVEQQRAVIRKGTVELRADDVGKAQFDVQRIVDRYDGNVTGEETTADDDGNPAFTRMVLRIPEDQFDEVMGDLKGIEETELGSANTREEDVTTKLIDTRTRIEAQKRSIARITILFDRAVSIRDIMAIESQLSRRQADLEALQRTAAYLAGQTSMSTIVVSIDEIPAEKAKPVEEDNTGFITGLKAGWDALATFAVGLATALGALLPWLVVVAILTPPTVLIVRAIRRRADKTGRTPSAA